jgi:hypothetical protein
VVIGLVGGGWWVGFKISAMWVPRWELGWRRDYKGRWMREK